MKQGWLLPYENPLQKRFGAEFFKGIPKTPGVYFMIGTSGYVLYVGKAKNLRARLSSYRRAHPDQISGKVIRMIQMVRDIRWENCGTEQEALLRENQAIRSHRPPFNVVNTNPEGYFFIGLKMKDRALQFRLSTELAKLDGFERFGAYKCRGTTRRAFSALLRLLWIANAALPKRFEYPSRLLGYHPPEEFSLRLSDALSYRECNDWFRQVRRFLNGTAQTLLPSLSTRILLHAEIPRFIYACVQEDLEMLTDFFEWGPRRNGRLKRRFGLRPGPISQELLDDLLSIAQATRERAASRRISADIKG